MAAQIGPETGPNDDSLLGVTDDDYIEASIAPSGEFREEEFIAGPNSVLGRWAVWWSVRGTRQAIKHGTEVSRFYKRHIAKSLDGARKTLASIPEDTVETLDEMLDLEAMPKWLANNIGLESAEPGGAKALLLEEDDSGKPKVSDETLLNVLQWHNHRIVSEQRAPVESGEWSFAKGYFKDLLGRGVRDGWLPRGTLSTNRMLRIDNTQLRIDDGLGTIAKKEVGSSAVMNDHDIWITLPTHRWEGRVYHPSTVTHEFTHIVAGKDVSPLMRRITKNGLYRTGLYRMFKPEDKGAGRVLNEAIVEHIAETMHQGSPDVTNPDVKYGTYAAYRSLLDALCNGGEKPIDVRLFINAYFEDTKVFSRRHNSAIVQLARQLKQAFPEHKVLKDLAKMAKSKKKVDPIAVEAYAVRLKWHYQNRQQWAA